MAMVAGTWDDNGGKPSGYMRKLGIQMQAMGITQSIQNGGYWNQLGAEALDIALDDDLIMWFPDVPNEKEKIVGSIKKRNPKTILVS